ncbi:Ribosomal RNA-processing protein 17 [Pseudocercospora fuligena]|uniref:Ribosomal RNA-processing protein 17 n=1 Tax=Pseudocercospora fuligena TaxID=685502 RepID=A0A8H6VIB1_9PEZI|nr:Ribosomal RNA-processing protein 17 [Pseudocercospora fuligena]
MAPSGKKRKRDDRYGQIEELTFNPEARQEYLTGFSKRKQARKDHAKEVAIKREKEEKIKERKALREQKKQEVEEHVQAVNEELKKQNALINGDESEGDFEGFEETSTKEEGAAEEVLPSDEEYVDEDKYTTVTVEPMGESDAEDDQEEAEEVPAPAVTKPEPPTKKKRPWQKDGDDKKKVKKKKFRYESKAERAVTRKKQKSRNSKAAAARKKEK